MSANTTQTIPNLGGPLGQYHWMSPGHHQAQTGGPATSDSVISANSDYHATLPLFTLSGLTDLGQSTDLRLDKTPSFGIPVIDDIDWLGVMSPNSLAGDHVETTQGQTFGGSVEAQQQTAISLPYRFPGDPHTSFPMSQYPPANPDSLGDPSLPR